MNRNKIANLWKRPNGWDVVYCPQTARSYPTVRIPIQAEKVQVAFIGDLHYGLKQFAREEFLKFRQWIIDNKAVVFLMGDLMECATKKSPGDAMFEVELNNDQQVDGICDDLLAPIKEQIVGAVRGNHEFRVNKETGLDPMNFICNRMKIPFLGWEGFAVVSRDTPKKGQVCSYSIYTCHSYAANKDAGLALHWSEMELEKWLMIDIIARGHSHDMGFQPTVSYLFNKSNMGLTEWIRYLMMTGHWLRRPGGYNQQKPKRGKPRGTVSLELTLMNDYRNVFPQYHVYEGGDVSGI